MIFVTLGSQKFQFNRLLRKIDELVGNGKIKGKVFAQIGYSDYVPVNYEYDQFVDRKEFFRLEAIADVIITHGGTGAIIGAVKKGKKVIAVPRLAAYGEHVDDHQLQIIEQFTEHGFILSCINIDDLENCLNQLDSFEIKTYVSNTQSYIKAIEKYTTEI